MLIPAAQAAKKGVQVLKGKDSYYEENGEQFFAPLSCYRSAKPLGKEQQDEKHYVLLRLGRIILLNGRKDYRRLWSNKPYQLLSTDIPTKGKMEQIVVPQLPELNLAPWREISKLAISANHFLNNGFAISSITNLSGTGFHPENLRSRIEKWLPSNSNAHERTLVINFGINWKPGRALVEFKSMSSPVEVQDTFILQVYRQGRGPQGFDLQSVGLILLLPNGKSLEELCPQAYGSKWKAFSDWATITLPSGLVITAALRTRLRNGELVFAVDVDTNPSTSMAGVQR